MTNPEGESKSQPLRLDFDRRPSLSNDDNLTLLQLVGVNTSGHACSSRADTGRRLAAAFRSILDTRIKEL